MRFFSSLKFLRNGLPNPDTTGPEHALMDGPNSGSVSRALYELVQKGLKGILKRDQVAQALGEATTLHPEMASLVVDILCLTDQETNMLDVKDERERMVGIIKEAEKYLPEITLKERLEMDTLGEVGLVKNSKKFFTTVIKMKTKLL